MISWEIALKVEKVSDVRRRATVDGKAGSHRPGGGINCYN